MKRAAVLITFITLFCSVPAFAAGRPDFSGTWMLDIGKSDMGNVRSGALPERMQKVTMVIKQTPSALITTRKAGESSDTVTDKLDGSESIRKSPFGQDIRSTSRWVGPTLVTHSTMSIGEWTVEATFVRSLSADGRVMTIDITSKTLNGIRKQKLIYNKQ